MTAVPLVLLGVLAFAVGRWGAANAGVLAREAARKEGVLRRGALTCQVIGAALVVAAGASLFV